MEPINTNGKIAIGLAAAVIGLVFVGEMRERNRDPANTPEAAWAERVAARKVERQKAEQEAAARAAEEAEFRRKEQRYKAEMARRKELTDWAEYPLRYLECRDQLQAQLRDPDSYRDGGFESVLRQIDHDAGQVVTRWRFRARNGFGGYQPATAICTTKRGGEPVVDIQ